MIYCKLNIYLKDLQICAFYFYLHLTQFQQFQFFVWGVQHYRFKLQLVCNIKRNAKLENNNSEVHFSDNKWLFFTGV